MMLEGAGFEVIDLGINMNASVILEKVRESKPGIWGLSALLTTTMHEMGQVVQLLRSRASRIV